MAPGFLGWVMRSTWGEKRRGLRATIRRPRRKWAGRARDVGEGLRNAGSWRCGEFGEGVSGQQHKGIEDYFYSN